MVLLIACIQVYLRVSLRAHLQGVISVRLFTCTCGGTSKFDGISNGICNCTTVVSLALLLCSSPCLRQLLVPRVLCKETVSRPYFFSLHALKCICLSLCARICKESFQFVCFCVLAMVLPYFFEHKSYLNAIFLKHISLSQCRAYPFESSVRRTHIMHSSSTCCADGKWQ